MFTSWIAVVIIIILSFIIRKKLKEIPTGIQNFVEVVVEGALSLCDQVTNDRALSLKIFPVAISVFFFIFSPSTEFLFTGIPVDIFIYL